MQNKKFFAHLKKIETGQWEVHSLIDHLNGVAEISAKNSQKFDNSDWGEVAALLHDLGKYSNDFQDYIRCNSGYLGEEFKGKYYKGAIVHTTQGAYQGYCALGDIVGKIIAYLIAGHHGGLPDWYHEISVGANLQHRLNSEEIKKISSVPEKILKTLQQEISAPSSPPCGTGVEEEHLHLWVRMLFSSLVDADFLDTERFMDRGKYDTRTNHSSIEQLKNVFDDYMGNLLTGVFNTPVNIVRRKILSQCIKNAKQESGLFSLTVPTGGGKTLSAMAFALQHALTHSKDRIIVVIPYTSIIEQTAGIYKEIFGETNVIEHHSSLDPSKETMASRLASENWDAPIVVTTSVQFFESLFASRPSSCRKLHNIVNSVVLVDEVQMLPTDFLKPILHCINGLTDHFGVSMVLCTATQPALTEKIFRKGNGEYYSILEKEKCRELMVSPCPEELTKDLQRVDVMQKGKYTTWNDLASKLEEYNQLLVIVNTRTDCRELHEEMPEGTVHLSANMCGEHRSKVIENIKEKLKRGKSIRVVSTQLVEAGVDFDFPVVFRAMAGFDSIAQAAGRCNREGKLSGKGEVYVFEPPKQAPVGTLRKGEQAGKAILEIDPDGCRALLPQTFTTYFKNYYSDLDTFDAQNIHDLLVKDAIPRFDFQFRTAAQKFNLISNERQISVVVLYEGTKVNSRELIEELRYIGPYRNLMRKLQRFTISIPENFFNEVADSFEELHGIFCQNADTLYDNVLGFVGYDGSQTLII